MHPILLFGIGGAVAWGLRQRFTNRAARDLRALLSVKPSVRSSLDHLPSALRGAAERAVRDRARAPAAVRLEVRGDMRLKPGGPWVPFDAIEYLAVGHVAYCWQANLSFGGFVRSEAVDSLAHGAGRLETRLFGVLPAWGTGGPATTRAQTLRYLSELPWVPYALFANPALDFRSATDGAVEVAVKEQSDVALRLEMDARGDIVGLRGSRPRATPSGTVEQPWAVDFGGYDAVDGLRIPRQMEVRWETDPTFVYCRARVTGLTPIWIDRAVSTLS